METFVTSMIHSSQCLPLLRYIQERDLPTLGLEEFSQYSSIGVRVVAPADNESIQPELLRHISRLLQILHLLNLPSATPDHVKPALVAECSLEAIHPCREESMMALM